MQLEDQGGSGTAGSHWEARITKVIEYTYSQIIVAPILLPSGRRNEWSDRYGWCIFTAHICSTGGQWVGNRNIAVIVIALLLFDYISDGTKWSFVLLSS